MRTGDLDRAEENVADNPVTIHGNQRNDIRAGIPDGIDDIGFHGTAEGFQIHTPHGTDVARPFLADDDHGPSGSANTQMTPEPRGMSIPLSPA